MSDMTGLSIVLEILTIIHRAVWTLHEQEQQRIPAPCSCCKK
jgi:hypothetical protein